MAAMDDIDAAWLSFCEGVDMNMNGDIVNETENNSLTSEQNPLNVLNVAHLHLDQNQNLVFITQNRIRKCFLESAGHSLPYSERRGREKANEIQLML